MSHKVKLIGNYSPQLDNIAIMEAGTYNNLCVGEDDKYGILYCCMGDLDGKTGPINCVEIDGWREACLPHAFDIVKRISEKTGWNEKDVWDAILDEYLPRQNIPALWDEQK